MTEVHCGSRASLLLRSFLRSMRVWFLPPSTTLLQVFLAYRKVGNSRRKEQLSGRDSGPDEGLLPLKHLLRVAESRHVS